MSSAPVERDDAILAEAVIETHGLSKSFGPAVALRDLDLTLARGEVFGYLGPNGAGKTTTLRLLMGLLRPTRGSARVCGYDVWHESTSVRRHVGFLPGEPALYPTLTGLQHVDYLSHLRGADPYPRALVLAERLDLDLDTPSRDLSKGNRQKLAVVLALMPQTRVLVLDEPTSGLDPLAQQELHALMREHVDGGGTVLLSSHVLGEVQRVADRVGLLRKGRLVAVDRLDALRARSLHHVHATFDAPVPAAAFAGIDGVRELSVVDHTLTCAAPEASLDHIVKALGQFPLRDLTCTEAELEETFLAYYGRGEDDAA
ncbi:ABC transporter ATP-binding protein [Pedococcus sp. 2YAF34]|uniref:ABC transporter ATP-binding protein n=1 Tax=Pedococcus sp. 2YAF34 TaxID=3233032 RepID=UPI003F977258